MFQCLWPQAFKCVGYFLRLINKNDIYSKDTYFVFVFADWTLLQSPSSAFPLMNCPKRFTQRQRRAESRRKDSGTKWAQFHIWRKTKYLHFFISSYWTWKTAVGIVTGYGLDDPGSKTRERQNIFLYCYTPTRLPISWVATSLPEVQKPRRKADCLSPPRAEVAQGLNSTCTPICLQGRERGQLYLYWLLLVLFKHYISNRQHKGKMIKS